MKNNIRLKGFITIIFAVLVAIALFTAPSMAKDFSKSPANLASIEEEVLQDRISCGSETGPKYPAEAYF